MSIDVRQLRELVIKPACEAIGLWSVAAEELLLGTACQESKCGQYLHQLGNGPALGIFQMEPATYRDHWTNFLRYRSEMAGKLIAMCGHVAPAPEEMIWNLLFAAAMCRVHYYRVKAPLPKAGDLAAQAEYWKRHFNSALGAGTPQEYVANWNRYAVK